MRTYILLLFTLFTLATAAQSFNDLCREGIENIKNYEFQKAIANFEKAEATSTSKHEKIYCMVNIAYSRQMLGDLHGALKSYNEALNINNKELTLIQQRANIYLQLDSVEKALADYNTILKEEESNTGALLCRAHIYTNLGKYREAWNDYAMLERWLPDNISVQLGIAVLYQKEKKYTECMEMLDNLIKKNPDIPELYLARSNVEREQGYNELALMDINKAIELDPQNASNYLLQAIIYDKMGKKSAAKKSRDKATLLGKDNNILNF